MKSIIVSDLFWRVFDVARPLRHDRDALCSSQERGATLMLHKTRELFVKRRTMSVFEMRVV
jgi:hypothetical protein